MNQLQKSLIALSMLVLSGMLLAGCGEKGDNLVLAEVGSDKITADLLDEIFERDTQPFNSFQEELDFRKTILDSLIIQQLMIQEAYRFGLDASEEVNRLVLANTGEFLLDILYQRQIEDNVSASEKEVRTLYDSLEFKVLSSHILFSSEDSALMVMDSLDNGANFEDMAIRHSIDPSVSRNRGDIGYSTWGRLTMPFQEVIFNLKPGEISRPFKTNFGWHIAKVVDRVPNEERKSFEAIHETLVEQVKNGYRAQLMDSFLVELEGNYPVKVDTATIDYLYHKAENLYPPQILESMPKNDFDIDQLDRHEKELILATWDGGQMTLGQYLTLNRQQRPEMRPNLNDYPRVAKFIFQQNIMELLTMVARKKGLEDDPEFKRKLKRFKELTMADIVENDSIPKNSRPAEEDLRAFYDTNINQFEVPASIHVFEIMLSSEQSALEQKNKLKSLNQFKEAAAELTERPGYRAKNGDLGYIQQRYSPDLYNLASNYSIGQVAGPIKIDNYYSILYIADKRPAEIRDFAQAKQSIQTNMEAQRKQEALAQWVEEKKKEVEIKIYENNLRPGINKAKYGETDK
jgi:peptidyl-prolyl cis-trans isomerase C